MNGAVDQVASMGLKPKDRCWKCLMAFCKMIFQYESNPTPYIAEDEGTIH